MKVALIHYRITLRGGLETRLINYTNYFVEKGHDVTIICAKNTGEVDFDSSVKIVQLKMGLMPKPLRRVYFDYKLGQYLKNKKFDFELSLGRTSHQKAVLGPSNHKGFLKAMGKKTKSINDFTQDLQDQKLTKRCKIIYAASQMMKDEFVNLYGADSSKIKILFPPLNEKQFTRIDDAAKKELRLKNDIPIDFRVFVFVSASHYRKGLDILLKAFEQLQNEKVLLLIAGYPKVETQWQNVRFIGFASEPQNLYQMADCTLHPARYEPFGQIVSESLACGKPVFTSHMCGGKEILNEQTGKVIDSFDPSHWANSILNFRPEDYHIPLDFIRKKELSLEQHMEKMLEYYFKA